MALHEPNPRKYKGFTPRMGVYAVRHLPSGRVLLGSSPHLEGILNRHRFQLSTGVHPIRALQADWHRDGAGAFSFEILDELPQSDDAAPRDPRGDLAALEELWRERLALDPAHSYAR